MENLESNVIPLEKREILRERYEELQMQLLKVQEEMKELEAKLGINTSDEEKLAA